jgi:type VI secretion system protein ImpA
MATPPTIDIEALLARFPADGDVGRKAAHEAARFAISQILRGGAGDEAITSADLDRVIEQGSACLTSAAKDLTVAAWLVEALTRRHGIAGLRDGLTLMHRLIVACWEDCIPGPGRNGDLDLRARPLESLVSERSLLGHVRRSCLADVTVGAVPFTAVDVLKASSGNSGALSEADVTTGTIGESVTRSPRSFYECLSIDLNQAAETEQALRKEVRERFKNDAPDLRAIGSVMQQCSQVLELILAVKRRQEPSPPNGAEAAGTGGEPGSGGEEPITAAGSATHAFVPGPARTGPDRGRALIGFLEQARTLADAAAKLKENRERYETLKQEMETLDAEYETIADRIARDKDFEPLLARRLGLDQNPPPGN